MEQARDRGERGPALGGGPPSSRGKKGGRVGTLALTDAEVAQIQHECGRVPSDGEPERSLSDVHVHVPLSAGQGAFALALLTDMNSLGIDRAVIQPDHSPEMTQRPELMELIRRQEAVWDQIGGLCPRLIPLVYAFDPQSPDSVAYVRERLATGQYAGIGELEFQHGRMPIAKSPDGEVMEAVYKLVEAMDGCVHFQAELRRAPELGPRLRAVIEGHPKLRFVWFGCGPEVVEWQLENLWCDTFAHPKIHQLPAALLERSIWGSDTGPTGFVAASAHALTYDALPQAVDGVREVGQGLTAKQAAALQRENFDVVFPLKAQ